MIRLRVACIVAAAALAGGLAVADPAAAEEVNQRKRLIREKVEPSIVYLRFFNGDGQVVGFATGFVVADPDGNKRILTAAHSFASRDPAKRIVSVTYCEHGKDKKFLPCDRVWEDKEHDLAVLNPHPRFPLPKALPIARRMPGPNTRLYAIGSPAGLTATPFEGDLEHAEVTVKAMAAAQGRSVRDYAPLVEDLSFLQHSINIAPGCSGCPVVNAAGEVVGIQCSTLPGASAVGFAVRYLHLTNFNWKRPARDLAKDGPKVGNVADVLNLSSAKPVPYAEKPPVTKTPLKAAIRVGDRTIECPFHEIGYVERRAETVIAKYMQDQEYYQEKAFRTIRRQRLQELLDRTKVVRITNPVLGLEFLVPSGYTYGVQPTSKAKGLLDGLIVTFRPTVPRRGPKAYDWPLSFWVTVEPELFEQARAQFAAMVRDGQLKLTAEQRKSPAKRVELMGVFTTANMADRLSLRFRDEHLRLRVLPPNYDPKKGGKIPGDPRAEVFKEYTGGEGGWSRCNYFSLTGTTGHNVRLWSKEPLAIVTHFQFDTDDLKAYIDGGKPTDTLPEYLLIATSAAIR